MSENKEYKAKVFHYSDNPIVMSPEEKEVVFKDGEAFFDQQRAEWKELFKTFDVKVTEPEDAMYGETTMLPINVIDENGETFPLPLAIIAELIRRSSHRVITKSCNCRNAFECKAFDKNIGCLHIGGPTAEEPDSIARSVSVEEAIEYTKFAISRGLTPFIGRFELDHILWGIYSGDPFVTVCFCCPCCCLMHRGYKYKHPENNEKSWVKVPGVSMKIDVSKCAGEYCGVCVKKCPSEALYFEDGKLKYNKDKCLLCSRCQTVCGYNVFSFVTKDLKGVINNLCTHYDGQCGDLGFNGEDYAEAIIKNCPK